MARHGLLHATERASERPPRTCWSSAGMLRLLPYAMSGKADKRSRNTPEELSPAVREGAGQRLAHTQTARKTTTISGGGVVDSRPYGASTMTEPLVTVGVHTQRHGVRLFNVGHDAPMCPRN